MSVGDERRRDRGRPRTWVVIVALVAAGCVPRYEATLSPDQNAVLEPEEGTLIEALDGVVAERIFRSGPIEIPAGRRTVRLRRRVEVPAGARGAVTAPLGSSIKVASDPHGNAAYTTDSTCTLTFEARAGARYLARTAGDVLDEAWVGSIVGPDVDARCIARDSVADNFVGQTRYLCCAMTFDDGQTTDANYRYSGRSASRLAPGTRVVVTDAGRNRLSFRVEPDGETYQLHLEYGLAHLDAEPYFNEVLREDDPAGDLHDLPPTIAGAIAGARLVPGMTREQAIMARGYPPLHRTPDRTASKWLYYDAPGTGVYVTFADGVIKTVRSGAAP